MADVSLRPVEADDQSWLHQVFKDYFEELARYDPTHRRLVKTLRLDPEGFFRWIDNEHLYVLVIEDDGVPAGFSLITVRPHPSVDLRADARMGEFFVQPEHRRRGVGRRAAEASFARTNGTWEVVVLENNGPAMRFWPPVIHSLAAGETVTEEESYPRSVRYLFQTG
jgi:predicted acetyltransferase